MLQIVKLADQEVSQRIACKRSRPVEGEISVRPVVVIDVAQAMAIFTANADLVPALGPPQRIVELKFLTEEGVRVVCIEQKIAVHLEIDFGRLVVVHVGAERSETFGGIDRGIRIVRSVEGKQRGIDDRRADRLCVSSHHGSVAPNGAWQRCEVISRSKEARLVGLRGIKSRHEAVPACKLVIDTYHILIVVQVIR